MLRRNLKLRKSLKRPFFLPEKCRPETVMYEYLFNLSDNDSFWDDNLNFTKYCKQFEKSTISAYMLF